MTGRSSGSPRVVDDPERGYRHLDPLPVAGDTEAWYESHYAAQVRGGIRAPDLLRLLAGGPDAAAERSWQGATLHADILDALERAASDGIPRTVVDLGCGTGEVLDALTAAGWSAVGTEPATQLAELGRSLGRAIDTATAIDYLAGRRARGESPLGAILLLNVLEHVPEPLALLALAHDSLAPGGRVVVRVPNDFSPLQLAAQARLGGDPWWVIAPDHVNYFDYDSIAALLGRAGFEVLDRSGDFPMELFLLLGHDYRTDPAVGQEVHRRRRDLEMAIAPATRRAMARAWAGAGIGRNALLVGRAEP